MQQSFKRYDYPVVILAGGLGTRLREETEFRPKPMVPIGGKPILWHIMKIYAHYGFYRFIICLGYKGEMIKQYFLNYKLEDIDFTINTKTGNIAEHTSNEEEWEVTLAQTGTQCYTGGRIARIAKYINTDRFLLTYGDGVSDVNIEKLVSFHQQHGKLATLTGVNPPSRFGNVETSDNQITSFAEKTVSSTGWINGGFFVLERAFLDYITDDPKCILEQKPLSAAAQDGELMIYKHQGFWQCMDTIRDQETLEKLWRETPPWKVWNSNESVTYFGHRSNRTSRSLAH